MNLARSGKTNYGQFYKLRIRGNNTLFYDLKTNYHCSCNNIVRSTNKYICPCACVRACERVHACEKTSVCVFVWVGGMLCVCVWVGGMFCVCVGKEYALCLCLCGGRGFALCLYVGRRYALYLRLCVGRGYVLCCGRITYYDYIRIRFIMCAIITHVSMIHSAITLM